MLFYRKEHGEGSKYWKFVDLIQMGTGRSGLLRNDRAYCELKELDLGSVKVIGTLAKV